MAHRRTRRTLPLLLAVGLVGAWLAGWLASGETDRENTGSARDALNGGPIVQGPSTSLEPLMGAEPLVANSLPTWRDDEVMVSARAGASLADVATSMGTTLRRPAGRSGYAPMRVPAGMSRDALLAALHQDPRIASAAPMGAIYGAAAEEARADAGGAYVDLQWHLEAMNAPSFGARDLSGVTVAVLDTGVAYEDHTEGDERYTLAPSLASTTFVAPYDFANDDEHANDDHQHGTHITSLIASNGDVEGVASGVSIMPLKVLDADNVGSEVDLIDAILWAVDNGADIINMSLAFTEGYAPSTALRSALQTAADAGVLMVAAAGNGGDSAALYPAASPLVLSVGASALDEDGGLSRASYSNISPTVDLVAPGGDLSEDRDGDGYVDGVLAETINPDDPTDIGLWLYAGTSQATALVTGVAAHLIAAGETDPERLARALQAGAISDEAYPYYSGVGAGDLDAGDALDALSAGGDALDADLEYHVSVLPYLRQTSTSRVQPYFTLKALDSDGEPVDKLILVGSIWGSSGDTFFKCKTDSDGVCTVKGTSITHSVKKVPRALAWGVSVDAAYPNTGRRADWQSTGRPTSMFYSSDGLTLLTEALAHEDLLWDSPLAVAWSAGTDEELGKLYKSYSVVNMAAGAATRPEGLLFTEPAISSVATLTDVSVSLAGLGFDFGVDDPGTIELLVIDISAEGIESDPFGFAPRRLIAMGGVGIESDPFGIILSPRSLYLTGLGIESDPFGIGSGPVLLSKSLCSSCSPSFTSLETLIGAGGWLDEDGYPGATALMSSGAVGMAWSSPALSSGAVGGLALGD